MYWTGFNPVSQTDFRFSATSTPVGPGVRVRDLCSDHFCLIGFTSEYHKNTLESPQYSTILTIPSSDMWSDDKQTRCETAEYDHRTVEPCLSEIRIQMTAPHGRVRCSKILEEKQTRSRKDLKSWRRVALLRVFKPVTTWQERSYLTKRLSLSSFCFENKYLQFHYRMTWTSSRPKCCFI